MIKKIIIIVAVVVLFIVPVVSADDFDIFPDEDTFITYSYNVKNPEVEIGGVLEYSITITNLTEMAMENFVVNGVFEGSYKSGMIELDELYSDNMLSIEPYQTVTIERSRIVPDDITWYEVGESYYTNFSPSISYCIPQYEEYTDKYGDKLAEHMTNNESIPLPLKITNIRNGSEYIDISFVDDRTILPFEKYRYNNEEILSTYIYSYISVKNLSDKAFNIVDIKSYDYLSYNYYVDPGEDVICKIFNSFRIERKDLNEAQIIKYKVLMLQDETYYALEKHREFGVMLLQKPNISIKVNVLYDEEKELYYNQYTVKNMGKEDIENFAVSYNYIASRILSYDDFLGRNIVGTIHGYEEWEIPVKYTGQYEGNIYIGYFIEGSFYDWMYLIHNTDTEESILESTGGGKNDYYMQIHDIVLSENNGRTNEYEDASSPTPLEGPTEHNAVSTPLAEPTENHDVSTPVPEADIKIKKYYIPSWAWIAVLAAAVVSGALIYYIKKSKKDE